MVKSQASQEYSKKNYNLRPEEIFSRQREGVMSISRGVHTPREIDITLFSLPSAEHVIRRPLMTTYSLVPFRRAGSLEFKISDCNHRCLSLLNSFLGSHVTMRIATWLPRNEFNKLKHLWLQSDILNSKEPALLNGTRLYVVINGRLMTCSADGKLNNVMFISRGVCTPRVVLSSSMSQASHESPPQLSSLSTSTLSTYMSLAAQHTSFVSVYYAICSITSYVFFFNFTLVPKDTHSSQSKNAQGGSQVAPSH